MTQNILPAPASPSETEELQAVLECVVGRVQERLEARVCVLLEATGEEGRLNVLVQQGMDPERERVLRARMAGLTLSAVLQGRDWTLLEGDSPQGSGRWSDLLGTEAGIALQLQAREGAPLGLVLAGLSRPPDISALLGSSSACLEQATRALRFVGMVRDMKRELAERDALLRVTHALARAGSGEEVLSFIVRTAVESIEAAESGVIHLLAEDGESLVPMGVSAGTLPRTQRANLRLGVGIAGVALLEGRPIRCHDVTTDPHYVPGAAPPPYRALLVAPMLLAQARIGTLSLQSSRPGAFSERDEQFLAILAGQAAMVVENDRLLRELRRRLEELRQAQAWLVRTEKLAATGRLAASIAHEINNPLEGIKNFLAVLEERLPPDDENRELLRLIGVGFQRIQKTTRQLLSFSRKEEVARQPCDLREPIENALAMVRNRLAMQQIVLEERWDEPLPQVLASPEQMEQVFLNLFLNAADAMGESGGRLEVHGWREGGEVCVAVRDTGPGIPEEIRDRIFEPFVTTKNGSSGLGLWVSYGIVTEHGGRVDVESEPGKGTAFTVRLPALSPPS